MKLLPIQKTVKLYETKFEDDILDREKFAKQLNELMEKAEDPLVIALDGKWGSGKSYFLQRWVGYCPSDSFTTVYFDAFETDYLSEPFISITSAVSDRIPKKGRKKWEAHAYNIGKPVAGILANIITLGAKEQVGDVAGEVLDIVNNQLINASDKFWKAEAARKNSMATFKETLSTLAQNKPLIIVVDELDRCRPDYALKVLEVIKHFFNVPNVHFILGVNLLGLENSVKSRYGAEIDAKNYLKKFINITTSLPEKIGIRSEIEPIKEYAKTLSNEMQLNSKLIQECIELILCVNKNNAVSLRDVEKICSKIALVPKASNGGNLRNDYIRIISILIVASVVDEKFHLALLKKSVEKKHICNFLGVELSDKFITEDGRKNPKYYDTKHEIYYWDLCSIYFGKNCDELNICQEYIKNQEISFFDTIDFGRLITIQNQYVDIFKSN